MTSEMPLVSIGVPLYNAEATLTRALDKLMHQDYPNIEIIISDNASTDATWEMCQGYSAGDSRIKLYRNDINLGATENFQRVYHLASGKYFFWAAHDDDRTTDYITRCVEQLEAYPEAVLCYTDQRFIDVHTNQETILHYTLNATDSVSWRRASQILTYKPTPYSLMYGIFRREAIASHFPFPSSPIIDIHFLLLVAQAGTFVHVPQVLFTKGVHAKEFHSRMKSLGPLYGRLPAFMVYSIMFFHLLGFSWSAGKNMQGRFHLATASAYYSLPRMITHLVPVSIRRWLRQAAKHNRLLNTILHPFLSTKQSVE